MPASVLQQALDLAAAGIPVFPCGPDKRPILASKVKGKGGFYDASRDPQLVRQMFGRSGVALVGMPTGEVSGFDILDIDTRAGGRDWEAANLHRLPETRMHRTPGLPKKTDVDQWPMPGTHYVFRHAPGVRNSKHKLARGIDIRGDGGYACWPPCGGYEVVHEVEPVDWPSWLLELVLSISRRPDPPRPAPGSRAPVSSKRLERYIAKLLANISAAPNDGKHDTLLNNTITMGGIIEEAGITIDEAVDRAVAALPSADDWDNARKTARDGIMYGLEKPITLEDREDRRPRRFNGNGKHPPGLTPPTEPPPPTTPEGEEPAAEPDQPLVTEDSVALAFVATYKDTLRFNHDAGVWFLWDGWIWHRQTTRLAYHWAREAARLMALDSGNFRTRIPAGKASFAGGVERFAQADPAFAVTNGVWNADPFLLGTPRGTVDLRTGYLTEPKQDDFISRKTSVVPSEEEDCPRFLEFLEQITQKDKEVIGFLKRWFGYCLTGDTREHALLFAWGAGGNGKGVLMNTVYQIMGEYAASAPMDTFTERKYATHTTDLAMLAGARLVLTSEIDEGAAWAEAKLKQLTGGDPITARFMRRDNFTYLPVFKVNISGNHKPSFSSVDDAMRRRLTMVPFLFKPEHPDKSLPDRLKAEYPGILRWMITGCLDWQAHGLSQPASVIEATKEYFAAQDFFHRWLDECCTLGQGQVANGVLLKSFQQWCNNNGEEVKDNKALRGMLEKHPGIKCVMIHGKRFVQGIALKPPEDDPRAPTDEMWQR